MTTCLFANSYVSHLNQKKLEEIVLSNTAENKTVMFGESHKEYKRDSDFVRRLLPKLKKQGFNYFALEVKRNFLKNNLSDISKIILEGYGAGTVTNYGISTLYSLLPEKEKKKLNENLTDELNKIIAVYALGNLIRKNIHPYWIDAEKEEVNGWFDLIDTVKKTNMKIVCYDTKSIGEDDSAWNNREKTAFNNLKELIFNNDPNAKVIIYCGGYHINEKPSTNLDYLGFYLDQFTEGKNFTIYCGDSKFLKSFKPSCDLIMNLDNTPISRILKKIYEMVISTFL